MSLSVLESSIELNDLVKRIYIAGFIDGKNMEDQVPKLLQHIGK